MCFFRMMNPLSLYQLKTTKDRRRPGERAIESETTGRKLSDTISYHVPLQSVQRYTVDQMMQRKVGGREGNAVERRRRTRADKSLRYRKRL